MKPIKIAIAEDHQLVRQGIISLLTDEDDLEVVIEAENGAILLDQLKLEKTDIVLLDLEMPVLNGQDALKFITDRYPDIRVIIVSMFYADEFISECIMAGARGFLPKNCDIENGVLSESALVENIAQTCAAGFGYVGSQNGEEAGKLGFIGAVSKLKVSGLPKTGDKLATKIEILNWMRWYLYIEI